MAVSLDGFIAGPDGSIDGRRRTTGGGGQRRVRRRGAIVRPMNVVAAVV
jgi:hypothetical protein